MVVKPLNPRALAVISESPARYRTIMERAFTTNRKSLAIKAFCLRCVGYEREEVRRCTSFGCPLWTHRPYQDGDED